MLNRVFSSLLIGYSFFVKGVLLILITVCLSFSINAFPSDDVHNIDLQDSKKLIKKAKKLHRSGKNREAEKILRQIIAKFPQQDEAKLDLAYILLKEKRLLQSFNLASEVAKNDTTNAHALAILGATFLSAGNFIEARKFLSTSLSHDSREALARAGVGMLLYYENKPDESIKNLRVAVFEDSKEPDYLFALAQVAARSDRYKEAAEAYERFLRIAPSSDSERKERIKGLIRFLRFLDKKASIYRLAGEKETTIPLNVINNRPVIDVRLKKNGESLRFVLDTGSGMTVLSENTAERLGINKITKGGEARALGGDGKFNIVYGFLNNVHIGDVQIKNVPIYIRKFHNSKNDIDGYIGLSVISKFITTIDYGSKTFSLTQNEEFNKRPIQSEQDATTVPLRLTSSGFLSGQVKLEGFEMALNFIVDTGASVSVISEELANSQEMQGNVLDQKIDVIGAAGITENVPLFLLPTVSFGGYSRTSLRAIALNLALINEASGFEQAGILGGNFLMNYRLTFDFEKSKVTFEPITY